MKTKSKTKSRNKKQAEYPAHYLAITLALVLLLEGWVGGSATSSDWQNAVSVLDMTPTINEVTVQVGEVFQPMIDVAFDVNNFYQIAATELMPILDLSDMNLTKEIGFIFDGVTEFYSQATTQTIQLVDASNSYSYPAVAGIAIGR